MAVTSGRRSKLAAAALGAAALAGAGCALKNGFLDPTAVGAFPAEFRETGIRRVLTPRDTPPGVANATEPTPDDLIPDFSDYRIGPGDQISIVVDDLINPGLREEFVGEVSSTGYVRIVTVGSFKVTERTEQEVEQEIRAFLKDTGKLNDPVVRVFVQVRRQKYFSIIGAVGQSGPYALTEPDTRLLDVLALARDTEATVKRLYVIRRSESGGGTAGGHGQKPAFEPPAEPQDGKPFVIPPPVDEDGPPPSPSSAFLSTAGGANLAQDSQPAGKTRDQFEDDALDQLLNPKPKGDTQPANVKKADDRPFGPLIYDPQTGQPIQVKPEKTKEELEQPAERTTAPVAKQPGFNWDDVPEFELQQRVIEIDIAALKNGDPRYNIVVRNRDVINVPIDTGVFYLMGEINRPGVYSIGGREITIKQAVSIAGGFAPLAWPSNCELIRREEGTDKQITTPLNIDRIFAGLESDVILRDGDIVNVGTHVVAPFLYVVRNSFRFTYGFGFVYDRNFADKDSYGSRSNPEQLAIQRRQSRGLPF